jgi:hypothetical protein
MIPKNLDIFYLIIINLGNENSHLIIATITNRYNLAYLSKEVYFPIVICILYVMTNKQQLLFFFMFGFYDHFNCYL